MRSTVCLLALTAWLVSCAPKTPEPEVAQPESAFDLAAEIPLDAKIRIGTLENGLKYYIKRNEYPKARAVIRLAVDVGSVVEDDDQIGLAHVVEHMAFNGSEHFEGNDLIKYLESVGTKFGAHLNAHTSTDETIYKLQIPTDDPEVFEKAFVVFQDWASGLTMDQDEIEAERGVVLEEWRGRRGAGARFRDETRPLTYKDSQYADRNTIGTEESLKTFEPDALRRFYSDWYRPNLMALVVVGDFEPDAVEQKIKDHFSGLTNPESPRERPHFTVDDHEDTLYKVYADPELTQTAVSILVKHDDPYDTTYGGYRDGLIRGLFYAVLNERLGDVSQQLEPPFLRAYAGPANLAPAEGGARAGVTAIEGRPLEAVEALVTEMSRIRATGVSQAELDRAQTAQLRSYERYYSERDKTHSSRLANEFYRNFTIGESLPGIEHEYEIVKEFMPGVTVEVVNAYAKEWMSQSSRVVTMMSPEKEGLEVPTEAALEELIARVEAQDFEALESDVVDAPLVGSVPEQGTIAEREEVPELGVTVWTLSNGARLVLKPTDFKKDEIRLSAFSQGGYSLIDDELYVPAQTAVPIVARSGYGEFEANNLRKRLAGQSVSVRPYIGNHREGLTASASPDDIKTMFELIHLAFTQPRFDELGLALDRRSRENSIRNRLTNPNVVFGDKFNEIMYQGHPRYEPWTLATLDKLDLAKSRAFYQERFANSGDFTFVLVGAFTLEDIEPLVNQYIASLPSNDTADPVGDDGSRRVTGIKKAEIKQGIEQKGAVRLEFHGDFESNPANRSQLAAMTAVLSTLLREELREARGGVYGVRVSNGVWEQPEEGYRLTISFGCDPDRVDELEKATFEVLEAFVEAPVEAHYVDKEKAKNERSHETNLLDNGYWIGQLASYYRRGEDPLNILDFEARNDKLTPEFVHEAAKKYIDMKQYVRVTLLPEGPK